MRPSLGFTTTVTRSHGPRGNAVFDAPRPRFNQTRRHGTSEHAFTQDRGNDAKGVAMMMFSEHNRSKPQVASFREPHLVPPNY